MLNVMLLRTTERRHLQEDRRVLAEDERRVFTVIVDELHMYRGTAGTEIAFLLRKLLYRLGLADAPERVRYLAASASAGASEPDQAAKFTRSWRASSRSARAVHVLRARSIARQITASS